MRACVRVRVHACLSACTYICVRVCVRVRVCACRHTLVKVLGSKEAYPPYALCVCVCVCVCVVLNAPDAIEVEERIFDYSCNFLTLP